MRERNFGAIVRVAIAFGVVLTSGIAHAYPTAVVFSPTGEAKPAANIGLLAYASTNLSPAISPGATWFGIEVGVLPQFEYGKGLKFGGLELGFDTISPYGAIVKPVLNAKLGFVTEGTYSPAVAAGIMQISPALASMNFVYLSATKTLQFGGEGSTSFGRVTLGIGISTGNRAQYNGTFPFVDSRAALMLAYETPLLAKRVGLVVDHLGGASEISSTYVGPTLVIFDGTNLGAGAYFANDRSNPAATYDGFFGYLSSSFDVVKLFSSDTAAGAPPSTPPDTTTTARPDSIDE